MLNEIGVNDFTLEELDELFKSDVSETSPSQNEETEHQNDSENNSQNSTAEEKKEDVDTTKAFAKRLRESTDKARQEERETIAKSLGYESYEDMRKQRENKMLEEKGLDPEQVSPVVEELVKKRLDEDPRMKELEELRKQKIETFGKQELAEISKLTNGEVTDFKQLSKEVIDLWKTKGSLKSAYLELEGEKLITKIRSEQNRGSTSHLKSINGNTPEPTDKRPLTKDEKDLYRFFNPGVTDEQLNNKMYNK